MMLVLSRACTCCTSLLLNATSTHSPSICPSIRRHLLISGLCMHLPTVLWAWIRAPTTHFFWRTDPYYTCGLNKRPAATLAFPLFVSVLSSQYLFQRDPIWMAIASMLDIPSHWRIVPKVCWRVCLGIMLRRASWINILGHS